MPKYLLIFIYSGILLFNGTLPNQLEKSIPHHDVLTSIENYTKAPVESTWTSYQKIGSSPHYTEHGGDITTFEDGTILINLYSYKIFNDNPIRLADVSVIGKFDINKVSNYIFTDQGYWRSGLVSLKFKENKAIVDIKIFAKPEFCDWGIHENTLIFEKTEQSL